MRILIIEDEPLAAAQLAALVVQLKPGAEIAGVCDTVESAVKWFTTNLQPDLAFFDIQLGDGLSFEIFKSVEIATPVIFTTAYDNMHFRLLK